MHACGHKLNIRVDIVTFMSASNPVCVLLDNLTFNVVQPTYICWSKYFAENPTSAPLAFSFTLNCPLIILLDVLDSIDVQIYFQPELVQLHLAVQEKLDLPPSPHPMQMEMGANGKRVHKPDVINQASRGWTFLHHKSSEEHVYPK